MSLSNCKVELKIRWTKNCDLSAADNDNANADPDNIIFAIKGTTLYVPVVTFLDCLLRDNPKLSKLLSKGCERSVYCNEYKTKSDNQNTMQPARDVLGTSPEGPLKVLTPGTSRGPSGYS